MADQVNSNAQSTSTSGTSISYGRESPNLFTILADHNKAVKEEQAAVKKEKDAEQKSFDKFVEYDVPDYWHEYSKGVKDKYNEYQDYVAQARKDGKYTDPDVMAEIAKKKGEIDILG